MYYYSYNIRAANAIHTTHTHTHNIIRPLSVGRRAIGRQMVPLCYNYNNEIDHVPK